MDPRVAVPAPGLQQQHRNVGIGTQAIGEDAPGRARTDDDVVELSDTCQWRGNLLSRFRAGKCLLINVLLYIAEMAQHLRVRFLPVTGRNSGGDRFVEAGIHRLALEAMRMFTQAAPAGVALLGAHGIEEREKQCIAGGFRDGPVEAPPARRRVPGGITA